MKFSRIVILLFLLELILGFNGTLLLVGKISIREITFLLIALTLYWKAFKIIKIKGFSCTFKTSFSTTDYIFVGFLVINTIWVVFVPQLSGTSLTFAIKEALCFGLFILYFPISIILHENTSKWDLYYQWIINFCLILGGLYILLYLGEYFIDGPSFSIAFFEKIGELFLGNSRRPLVMMPQFCIRIMYPNAILLNILLYHVLKNNFKAKHLMHLLIGITAIYTTITKSLIIGAVLALLVFILMNTSSTAININKKGAVFFLSVALLMTVILNTFLFDNFLLTRTKNIFAFGYTPELVSSKLIASNPSTNEYEGTQRANDSRINQTKLLLNKWKERPFFGFGYGSSIEGNISANMTTPYSYEMFLPALLMKIGIIGVSLWLIMFLFTLYHLYFNRNKTSTSLVFLLLVLSISTQFNPFLFNTAGMGILLFILVELKVTTNRLNHSPSN